MRRLVYSMKSATQVLNFINKLLQFGIPNILLFMVTVVTKYFFIQFVIIENYIPQVFVYITKLWNTQAVRKISTTCLQTV